MEQHPNGCLDRIVWGWRLNDDRQRQRLEEWGEIYLEADENDAADRAKQRAAISYDARGHCLKIGIEAGWMLVKEWTPAKINRWGTNKPEGSNLYLRVYLREIQP